MTELIVVAALLAVVVYRPLRIRIAEWAARKLALVWTRIGLPTFRLLQHQILAAVEQQAAVSVGSVYWPTDIEVLVNPAQFRKLEPLRQELAAETATLIRELAEKQANARLLAEPHVRFKTDTSIPLGSSRVEAYVTSSTTALQPASRTRPIRSTEVAEDGLVLEVNGCEFPVVGSIVVGRSGNAGCPLKGETISREHAVISVDEEGLIFVEDQGSMNGTFVSGRRVESRKRITAQDRLRFGGSSEVRIRDHRRTRRMP